METQVQNDLSQQFVVFYINNEECGIDIQKITTIEKLLNITRVPKAPEGVKGVINLRGEIVPVVELAEKLKMPPSTPTENTRIVIFKVEDISVGFIVDEVVEVITLHPEQIENIAQVSSDIALDYIYGIGKLSDHRIVTLLNLDKLITFK